MAWFLENYLDSAYAGIFGGFPLVKDDEGFLTYRIPIWGGYEDTPWISVTDDLGDIVHGIFLNPDRWNGRLVQANGDIASFGDIIAKFTKGSSPTPTFSPSRLVWTFIFMRWALIYVQ